MLFNSYVFIVLFLPLVISGYYFLGKLKITNLPLIWLVASSLFYYGWWNPVYLWVIALSVIFNYGLGYFITILPQQRKKYFVLVAGILSNLCVLGYFKYANFFVDSLNSFAGTSINLSAILLPLAISFFTFQQITYLVDAYKGITKEHSFLHYCVFVTFFPQLIAGPIVHHSEMLPQFKNRNVYTFEHQNLAIGLTLFFIGLFKKVVIADSIALYASPVFEAADMGLPLTFFDAWGGALAFTFQLYFDFSGYSDMAIGCAKMFGIHLPINFYSPYKATSIIEFWRRWHITLSRFLKNYLYIPLGGNRKGVKKRYGNLMITMLLGGLWHGAAWNFVIWGGLHGIFLVVNNLWRNYTPTYSRKSRRVKITTTLSILLTFLSVTAAWVLFRAETLAGAMAIYRGMMGSNGFVLPPVNLEELGYLKALPQMLMNIGIEFKPMELFSMMFVIKLMILFVIVWFMPNSQELLGTHFPTLISDNTLGVQSKPSLFWKPNVLYAVCMALVAVYTLSSLSNVSEFLYYQF